MAIYGLKALDDFELRTVDGKVVKVAPGYMVRNCGVAGDSVMLQVYDPKSPAGTVKIEAPERSTSEMFETLHGKGAVQYLDTEADFRSAASETSLPPATGKKKKGQSTALCVIVLGVILLALCGAVKSK